MNHLAIGQLNEYQFFSAFYWSTGDTPPASQCITVQRPMSKKLCRPCIAAIAVYNFFSECVSIALTIMSQNTVELQWLEHLWDHENMFETGVVRANEC